MEKHKLPLTFKYMELFRHKRPNKFNSRTTKYVLQIPKFQTNSYIRQIPYKPLIRIL